MIHESTSGFEEQGQPCGQSKIWDCLAHSNRHSCIPDNGICNEVLSSKKARERIISLTTIEVVHSDDLSYQKEATKIFPTSVGIKTFVASFQKLKPQISKSLPTGRQANVKSMSKPQIQAFLTFQLWI
jgi:hypothetical protein